MMKYVNIGLAVVIAIVAIVAGVFYVKTKNANDEVVAEQTQLAEELSTQEALEADAAEDSTEATSYVELPGWTSRKDVKGDKEGISLEQAAAASKQTSTASNNTSSNTNKQTTKTPDASAKATTSTDAATTAATTAADAATTAATTADTSDKSTWTLASDITADQATGHYYRDTAGGLHYEAHKWKYAQMSDKKHFKECSICKYHVEESHSWNGDWDCDICGYQCPHTSKSYSQNDATTHTVTCAVCGKPMGT